MQRPPAARVKALEADIASGRAEAAAKADELGALTAQAETVAATAAALQLQLQQANDALKQAQAQVGERDAQLKSQHAELLAATNDLSAAQAQLAVKAKENEALATAGRELVSGGDSLANELVSLKQQSASLQQDLMAARAAALAGETRSHELESALGELTGPKAAFFTQLAQALPPDTGAMIQGDRFVFPSDIAFKSASAKLTPNARAKVLEIGQALAAASEVLPDDFQLGDPDRRPHRPQLGRRSGLRIKSRPGRGQSRRGGSDTGQGRGAAGAAGGGVVRRIPPVGCGRQC